MKLQQKTFPTVFNREPYGLVLLLIFHAVGVAGMSMGYLREFAQLTPANLTMSVVILFLFCPGKKLYHIGLLGMVGLLSILAEVVGVNTGLIFGSYYYGENLGIKIAGVPILIGLNWCFLVYGATELVANVKWNIVVKSILAAALITAVDILIEPVAPTLDFWYWPANENIAPLSNYFTWFILSIPLSYLILRFGDFTKRNKLVVALLLIQAMFFAALNITII